MKTVVVDLDGTLANVDHRVHLVRREKPDWDAFYGACDQDTPNEWCVRLIEDLRIGGRKVLIVSARRQTESAKTIAWLIKTFGAYGSPEVILLRPDGNHEPDTVLKKRWLYGFGKENVLFVVDDRQKVVDMWRAEGLTCLQCYAWEEFKK